MQKVPNHHFHLCLLYADDLAATHYESPPPTVSTKSTNFDNGRTPYLKLYVLSNNIAVALEKYVSGTSSTLSSTSSTTVFVTDLPLYYNGILPLTHH